MQSPPIVDIRALNAGDGPGKQRVARDLRAACVGSGFFYATGHGVPQDLMDAVIVQGGRLFALDAEAKRAIAATAPGGRGYALMGGRRLDGGAHAAVKEEFYLGRDATGDNRWPDDLPGFEPVMRAYLEAMHGLAARLVGGLALSLELPEDHLAGFCAEPLASLRLVRYPPEGAEAGAHTDFGALTVLLQDGSGGLQIFDRASGGWGDAPPVPGAFIVNLGDLFERWTNGRYRSTPHRVVHPAGVARISAPFFFTGAADYPIDCLPGCLAAGERPRHPPTTPARHLQERTAQQGF
jgi:isopenicillin N synthase-like dioxygenase